ncbi:flagellar motor protein MotB [uncultured Sulfuricurvum sp.]|uniref:flagellar motor protein MotB n=1 Tax=uncultured Sulfuricurvum sp. TaxID=430693 RepID=UPI002628CBA4|nr:flagellar motor protein MotB [uncultured Sulfuricurvum sp.]
MAKKKCKKCPECPAGEKWAVPTADFFSLLLALFIALYALASVNKEKLRAIKEEFVKIYDYAPVSEPLIPVVDTSNDAKPDPKANANASGKTIISGGGSILEQASSTPEMSSTPDTPSSTIQKLQQDLQQLSMGEGPLDQTIDGVMLKLPATIPFKGANATIDDVEMHLFIKRVAEIINTLPPSVDISVRGYTDNQPLPKNSPFRDNLDLSSKRAEYVVRELIQNGVSPERLSAAGFGPAKALASNANEDDRAKNRRVDFYMFVSNEKPLDNTEQSKIFGILNKLKQ